MIMRRFLAIANVVVTLFLAVVLLDLPGTDGGAAVVLILVGVIPVLSSIWFFKDWNRQ